MLYLKNDFSEKHNEKIIIKMSVKKNLLIFKIKYWYMWKLSNNYLLYVRCYVNLNLLFISYIHIIKIYTPQYNIQIRVLSAIQFKII